jgi:Lrp/AsnC family leucine-responsive transcriptional regulator
LAYCWTPATPLTNGEIFGSDRCRIAAFLRRETHRIGLLVLSAQDFLVMALDRIDVRLLEEAQRNNRIPSEKLGELVGLSATAVQRRLKRLRDAGVIEADQAIVNPKMVGRNVAMVVLVSLERERADIIDRFKQSIRTTPEVMSGFYVTGDADFVLTITARDMEHYEAFTRRFFYENADIKWFKTLVVMDRVKAGFAIPIHPEADQDGVGQP